MLEATVNRQWKTVRELGRDEGRAEGVAEGRAEGVATGRVEQLVRMAGSRFGTEAARVLEESLRAAGDPAVLDQAADLLFDCQSPADLMSGVRSLPSNGCQ